MKTTTVLKVLGFMYALLFFFCGIVSDFTTDLSFKVPMVLAAFVFLLLSIYFLILSKKEHE